MLACLRHHRVVGRDDQHRQVEARRAGEHVADEPLVAGDVDQASRKSPRSSAAKPRSIVIPRCFSAGRRSVSTPVRARTKARLAVVDVAGGAEDEVHHVCRLSVVSCRLSVVGCQLSVVGCQLSVVAVIVLGRSGGRGPGCDGPYRGWPMGMTATGGGRGGRGWRAGLHVIPLELSRWRALRADP